VFPTSLKGRAATEERLQPLKSLLQRVQHPVPSCASLAGRNEPVCCEAAEGLSPAPFRLLIKANPGGIRLSKKKATLLTQLFKPD